jgi:hypothetical protein
VKSAVVHSRYSRFKDLKGLSGTLPGDLIRATGSTADALGDLQYRSLICSRMSQIATVNISIHISKCPQNIISGSGYIWRLSKA